MVSDLRDLKGSFIKTLSEKVARGNSVQIFPYVKIKFIDNA